MTKVQSILTSAGAIILGLAVALVGTLVLKNDAITGLGILLIGTGAGGFSIPRPTDTVA